jgi:hypothetical protein
MGCTWGERNSGGVRIGVRTILKRMILSVMLRVARGLARRVEPSEIESDCDHDVQLAEDVQRAGMRQVIRIDTDRAHRSSRIRS